MHAVDNTQQLFLAIIYLKKFVLAVVVALPSYMLKVPIKPCVTRKLGAAVEVCLVCACAARATYGH